MEKITDVRTANMPSGKAKISDGNNVPRPLPVANYQHSSTNNSKTSKK